MMKKVLAMVLATLMCAAMFTACGAKEPAAEVKGETFDAGNVSALVPKGWMAFPVSDLFAEEENATDPDALQLCKGAKTEWDLFSKPHMQINHYGPDSAMMEPSKDWYDDAEDLEPLQIGGRTWKGFTAKSFDVKIITLWTEDGEHQYQLSIWPEQSDGKISLDDADVQAIIASIQPAA